MKKITIANQKGGVGKTTLLMYLAFYFKEENKRVLVIDLDVQGNASFSLKKYSSNIKAAALFKPNIADITLNEDITIIRSSPELADIESLDIVGAGNCMRQNLDKLSHDFDVCLIDTAPSLGVRMAAALYASDYVLSPIELEIYSIQGMQLMLATIQNIKKRNRSLAFLGMVPCKFDSRNQRHGQHLEELMAAYPNMMIPHRIGLRSSIADAVASGTPVWQNKKTSARAAAKEMKALGNYLMEKVA